MSSKLWSPVEDSLNIGDANAVSKFNLNYRIDASLREVPEDPASMQGYVDYLTRTIRSLGHVDAGNVRSTVKLLGEIGSYAKMLGKPDMALHALEKSLSLIDQHGLGIMTWAVHTLRYGDACRFKKDPLAAEAAFRSVLEMKSRAPELTELEDFAWQHLGKLKFDEGDPAAAEKCLTNALELRKKKSQKELLQSTELALRVVRLKAGRR